jgi:hypothetical protein
MQSYQVPQFLDSGNKILGPLTVAQLIYAMVGAGISFLIFNFFQALVPGIGILAIIPAAPVAALAAYLSLGKYNGRDADIYILKFIIHTVKPRRLVYARKPDLGELDQQLKELTPEKILSRWQQRKLLEEGEDSFRKKDTEYKISAIRNLGDSIENLQQNLMYETYVMEKKKTSTESMLSQLQDARGGRRIVQKPVNDLDSEFNEINRQQQDSLNFFGLKKEKEAEAGSQPENAYTQPQPKKSLN